MQKVLDMRSPGEGGPMGTKGLEEGGKVRTFPGSEGWRGVLVGWLSGQR